MSDSKARPAEILADSPITDESQDLLRRTSFVEALYQEIISLPFEDSFCFGLYGSWGEGKTSVLNFLKHKLQKNKEIILFEFDPWYFASKELILKHFLEGLGRTLRPSVPKKLRKFFEKNFRKFSLGVTVLGTGGQIAANFEEKDLLKLKDEINAQMVKIKKKLVVLIDDIDRLQHDEILLVFKLVKLIADFKHTAFVLSFDLEAVKSSLQRQNIDIDYVDKIIQKPISLPKIEQVHIDQFLNSTLEAAFPKMHISTSRVNTELERAFPLIYQRHANKLFTNLRSVKRYVNSLCSSLPPIVDEVNLHDFLLLEIIKVFAPKVYDDIYENWWFYVPQRYEQEVWNAIRLLLPTGLGWHEEEKNEGHIKSHVEELLKDEPRKDVLINILGALSPNINKVFKTYNSFDTSDPRGPRYEKRISSLSFPKYFTLRVPGKELPDALVEQTISSWNSTPPEKLEETINNTLQQSKQQENLAELLEKLDIFIKSIQPEIAPVLIRCLSKNSSRFKRDRQGGWLDDSEFSRAEHIVINLLRDKTDKTQISTVLGNIMQCSDSLDFASGIYILCTQYGNPDGRWTVLESMRKVLVDRFKNSFVCPHKDFFQSPEPAYVLIRLWGLCAEEENTTPTLCTVSKYVDSLL